MAWVEQHFHIPRGQVIAVNGKTARGSRDSFCGQEAIHLVSAWASETGVLLGQRKIDEKFNEITAVPELLKLGLIHFCGGSSVGDSHCEWAASKATGEQ
jgi:hypothetical protein